MGQIKIGDLGLSRLFSENTIVAKTMISTEYYKAPERTNPAIFGYHFKSDIWSLGCLLYELCTLRSPFNGEIDNAYALHKKICSAKYLPFPSQSYSDQLQFFVKSCMSVSSCDRPSAENCHFAARRMYIHFETLLMKYKKANGIS
uniref:non-specific serine/threonine protein kinase n=1 Tax=Panagrolaimus superbus TaxID=310955 RepID=A0A914YP15_9BILA